MSSRHRNRLPLNRFHVPIMDSMSPKGCSLDYTGRGGVGADLHGVEVPTTYAMTFLQVEPWYCRPAIRGSAVD